MSAATRHPLGLRRRVALITAASLVAVSIIAAPGWSAPSSSADIDADGLANYLDLDSDNDGLLDAVESPRCFWSEAELTDSIEVAGSDLAWNETLPLTNALDGDPGTYARLNPRLVNATGVTLIEYSFAAPAMVDSLVLDMGTQPISYTGGGDPALFKLQGWDGSAWVDLTTSAARTATGATDEVFTNTQAPTTRVAKLRLFGTEGRTNFADIAESTIVFSDYVASTNLKSETCADDPDGDGLPSYLDLDSDNDTIPDNIEAQTTPGYVAPGTFADANSDGVNDLYAGGLAPADTDGDGTANFLDLNSDNEGFSDIVEAGHASRDADKDGATDGAVGRNGLDNVFELADTHADVNGLYTSAADLPDVQSPGGEADYADPDVDSDSDSVLDAADLDADNDGILNAVESPMCFWTETDLAQTLRVVGSDFEWHAGYPVDHALDGDDSTFSRLLTRGDPATDRVLIEYSLAELVVVDELVLDMLPYPLSRPGDLGLFKLQGWDGAAWVDLTPAAARTVVNGQEVFANTLAAATPVSKLRIYGTAGLVDFAAIAESTVTFANYQASTMPRPELCSEDADADGRANHLDLDADNDSIPDNFEAQTTTDYLGPLIFTDLNDDGLADAYGAGLVPIDTDGDGTPNYFDLNSDDEGFPDITEAGNGALDLDGDGSSDGEVGRNGLDNSLDTADDYADVTGSYTVPTELPDVQFPGGEVDYLDPNFDSDADGLLDAADTDSDNDGILDAVEAPMCFMTEQEVLDTFQISGSDKAWADARPLSNALDGDPATTARLATRLEDATDLVLIEYELDAPAVVESLTLDMSSYALSYSNDPALYKLQGWDGSAWLDLSLSEPRLARGQADEVFGNTEAPAVPVSKLRIYGTGGLTELSEIQESELSLRDYEPSSNRKPGLCAADPDGDGFPNYLDLDSDNDSIPDNIEAQTTLGYLAPGTFTDANDDGVNDVYAGGLTPVDTDLDTTANYLDLNSDNEGYPDIAEAGNGSADTDDSGTTNGVVGRNGLDDALEGADSYSAVNGALAGAADLPDTQRPGGEADYADPEFDADGDGLTNALDVDSDNDGLQDALEAPMCFYTASEVLDSVELGDSDFSWNTTTAPYPNVLDGDPATFARAVPQGQDATDKTLLVLDLVEPVVVESLTLEMRGYGLSLASDPALYKLQGFDGSAWIDLDLAAARTATNGPEVFTNTLATATRVSKLRVHGVGGLSDFSDIFEASITLLDFTASTHPKSVGCTFDTDGDGFANFLDLDSDNDSIPDNIEGQTTLDYIPPGTFTDANNDGLNDVYESLPQPPDTDLDTVQNYLDLDSDREGGTDLVEAGNGSLDLDGDGRTDGPVGANGLDDTLDNGDSFADPNGRYSGASDLPDLQLPGGEADYADPARDTDQDGALDGLDLDSDNDGLSDAQEAYICVAAGTDLIGPTYFAAIETTGWVEGTGDARQEWIDGDVSTGRDSFNWEDRSTPLTLTLELTVPIFADGWSLANDYGIRGDGIKTARLYLYDSAGILIAEEYFDELVASEIDQYEFQRRYYDIKTVVLEVPFTRGATGGASPHFQLREVGLFINDDDCFFLDTDGDGITDNEDVDSDNDGISDLLEAGLAGDLDADNDGRLDSMADPATGDTDGDGLADLVDPDQGGAAVERRDTDADAIPDHLDLDSDADGIPDGIEAQTGLAWVGLTGSDSDGDGLDDAFAAGVLVPLDTDSDGLPDYRDLDSDDDTLVDAIEGGYPRWDANADGVLDVAADADRDGLVDVVDTGGWLPMNGLAGPLDLPDQDAPYDDDFEPDFRDLDSDPPRPELTLTKVGAYRDSNGDGLVSAGDVIDYTFQVTSSGTQLVNDVAVTDPLVGSADDLVCDAGSEPGLATMAPADEVTCEASYTLTQADLDVGSVTNTATVAGTDPELVDVTSRSDDPNNPADVDSDADGLPDDPTVTSLEPEAGITLTKQGEPTDSNGDGYLQPGEQLTYRFTVTNVGNLTLSDITITDPLLGGAVCEGAAGLASLAPADSATCQATLTLTSAQLDEGSVTNQATASAVDPNEGTIVAISDDPSDDTDADIDGDGHPDDPTATTITDNSGVRLTKTTTSTASGVGDEISYTLQVTNVGGTTLTDLVVTDPLLGGALCDASTVPALGELAASASVTCTGTYLITQDDLDAGGVQNSASVAGMSPDGPVSDVSDAGDESQETADLAGETDGDTTNDPTVFSLERASALRVTKDDPSGTWGIGMDMSYPITVTNTGNVTVREIEVTDVLTTAVVCTGSDPESPNLIETLTPGESVDCQASYPTTADDVATGTITNTATATGTAPDGPVTASGSNTVVIPSPSLSITKSADATAVSSPPAVGDVLSYTFVVTNTSSIAITDATINDPLLGGAVCTDAPTQAELATLEPGEAVTCIETYSLGQDDLDAGRVSNSAAATGSSALGPVPTAHVDGDGDPTIDSDGDGVPNEDAVVVALSQTTGLSVTKTVTTQPAPVAGQQAAFQILVTNTGNTSATLTSVLDPLVAGSTTAGDTVSCTQSLPHTLLSGQSFSCVATYTLTQDDVDAAGVTNTVSVTAQDVASQPVVAGDSVRLELTPNSALSVTKTLDSSAPAAVNAGDSMQFLIRVTNPGQVTLSDIVVTDSLPTAQIACPTSNDDTIARLGVGQSVDCVATYRIDQVEVDAGGVANTAAASGQNPAGDPVAAPSSTVTGTISQNDELTLTKTLTSGTPALGHVLSYEIRVTNSGNTTITDVRVSDSLAPYAVVDCGAGGQEIASLAPGQWATCSASYTVRVSDVEAGAVTNVARASGTSPTGVVTAASAPSRVTVAQDPKAELSKAVTAGKLQVGELVTYEFVVHNTGDVSLLDIVVTDPLVASVACPADTLRPDATMTCTAQYLVTQQDLDAGRIVNTVSLEATTGAGAEVRESTTDTQDLQQTPAIELAKYAPELAGPIAEGTGLAYSLEVFNTGNVTLSELEVTDNGASVTCQTTTLAPGDSTLCAYRYELTAADLAAGSYVNTATAAAVDPMGELHSASDSVTEALDGSARISINKLPPVGEVELNATLTYRFVVSNTGTIPVDSVVVTDPLLTSVDCPAGPLLPDGVVTCSGTYVVTQDDIDSGGIVNVASVEGVPTLGGDPVSDTSEAIETPIAAEALLSVTKSMTSTGGFRAGESVNYDIVVTNNGNVSASQLVVADPRAETLNCPGTTLAPNTSFTCTAVGTLAQDDIDAGYVSNLVSVAGVAAGAPVSASAATTDATVGVGAISAQLLAPTGPSGELVSDIAALRAGDPVTFGVAVRNDGAVSLEELELTSALGGKVSCPDISLAPAATTTCAVVVTLTQAMIDAGGITESVTAAARDTYGNELSDTDGLNQPLNQDSSLAVEVGEPQGTVYPGQTITYPVTISNPGNTTLTNVAVDPGDGLDCDAGLDELAPGDSVACTITVVVEADAGPELTQQVAVTATTPGGGQVLATGAATSPVLTTPLLSIVKGAPTGTLAERSAVSFPILITNVNDVAITLSAVTDSLTDDVTCQQSPGELSPGESLRCVARYEVTKADMLAGEIVNVATVAYIDPYDGDPLSVADEVVTKVVADAELGLTKSKPAGALVEGAMLRYQLRATNLGNVYVANPTLSDPSLDTLNCPQVAELAPGASFTCTGAVRVTSAHILGGSIGGAATAEGGSVLGPVSAAAERVTQLAAEPSLAVSLGEIDPEVAVGDQITVPVTITNDGNLQITAIELLIGGAVTIDCPSTTLAAGDSMVCQVTYQVSAADLAAGQVAGTVVVTGNASGISVADEFEVAVPISSEQDGSGGSGATDRPPGGGSDARGLGDTGGAAGLGSLLAAVVLLAVGVAAGAVRSRHRIG